MAERQWEANNEENSGGAGESSAHRFRLGNKVNTGKPYGNWVSAEFRQQEMIRLLIEGGKIKDIAPLLGLSKVALYQWLKRPEIREQIAQLKSKLMLELDEEIRINTRTKAQYIDELGTTALQEMEELLKDRTLHAGIRLKAMQDVLDRDPETSRTKKLDITERRLELKGDDLRFALQAVKEIEERKYLKDATEEAEVVKSEVSGSESNAESEERK